MAKKIEKTKKPVASGSKRGGPQSYASHHYATSIEAAIADRMQSMKQLRSYVVSSQSKMTCGSLLPLEFVRQMEMSLTNEFRSIDEYVDEDDALVDKVVIAIRSSLEELLRLIGLGAPVPTAIRREVTKIAKVIEGEATRYANAPTPGVYYDYE